MTKTLSALALAVLAGCASAPAEPVPDPLLGCWKSGSIVFHHVNGVEKASEFLCTRYYGADEIDVKCARPGRMPSNQIYGYQRSSASTYTMTFKSSDPPTRVLGYARPHEFSIDVDGLRVKSYPVADRRPEFVEVDFTLAHFKKTPALNARSCYP
jgi:hypothetical protein